MSTENKSDLKKQVAVDSRENGISYTLFRNAIGKQLGLHSSDFEGLDLIFFRGMTTPSELSKYTGLSSGSTTVMIDRLEKAGLVARQHNPSDRRGTLVVVTEEAACRVGPLFTAARVAQNEMLASYSADELKILSDFFKRSAALFDVERKSILHAKKSVGTVN
jgi:DNA-binding MarR family transcriptional regulator